MLLWRETKEQSAERRRWRRGKQEKNIRIKNDNKIGNKRSIRKNPEETIKITEEDKNDDTGNIVEDLSE